MLTVDWPDLLSLYATCLGGSVASFVTAACKGCMTLMELLFARPALTPHQR